MFTYDCACMCVIIDAPTHTHAFTTGDGGVDGQSDGRGTGQEIIHRFINANNVGDGSHSTGKKKKKSFPDLVFIFCRSK